MVTIAFFSFLFCVSSYPFSSLLFAPISLWPKLASRSAVPEEEDADDSQVEDPEKCSDAEKVEIIEQVGEALEENFTELEKMKASKESKDKPKDLDVEMGDAVAVKTNGDAESVKTDADASKTHGDSKDDAKTNGDAKEVVEANGEKMDEDKKPGNLP